MQYLSHETRAFIWNADGLQGFLKTHAEDIMEILRNAQKTGDLQKITKYQTVDLLQVWDKLCEFSSFEERMIFLS